ncbi:hypothetical protein [Synechocystis sp. LKSZ1]|uniref:hypothetical protein n=1 Tax=Synechocystis sp. LKSZ1 TaxID=3144951 RepID=UPI00336C0F11
MPALSGNSFKAIGTAAKNFFGYEIPDVLTSEKVRNTLGPRVFDFFAKQKKEHPLGGLGKLVQDIFGALGGSLNFIGGALKFLGAIWEKTIGWMIPDFSISGIWDFCVESYFEIKNFDWNQTDAQLEEAIKQLDIGIAAAKGSLAGTSVVWTVGAAVAAGVAFKWPVIAADMALEVAEEGSSEIAAKIGAFFQTWFRSTVSKGWIKALLSARRYELFGQKSIYSSDNKKPWTIADAIDKKIESIKDPEDRAYWRAFLDAVEDSIIDMGYVMAYSLDDFFQNNKYADQPPPDTERAIRLYLNPSNKLGDDGAPPVPSADDPFIYLEGDQEEVIQQAESALLQQGILGPRDVGEFLAVPYEEWQRATPKRANLQLRYYSKEKPPFEVEGIRRSVLNIPDPKPLTWQKIKQAAVRFTYGPVLTTVRLDNGRQMQVWASTPTEGLSFIKSLLTLSNAKMVGFPAHTEIDDSLLPPAEKKRSVLMYPAFGTYTIVRSTNGITDPSYLHTKNKEWAKKRFKIYVDTEKESDFESPLIS